MKTGPLWHISVTSSPEAEDAVLRCMADLLGAPASSCTDLESGRITVSVFLPKSPKHPAPSRSAIASALAQLDSSSNTNTTPKITIRSLKPENWAESWKRHFKPIEISPALLIKPSWSKKRPRKGQSVVVLDPGLSFGTGQHPTTSFCLEQTAKARKTGTRQSYLDMGCGSGILAIAAFKLGFDPVDAFDFDPDAVRIARENTELNRTQISLFQADVTKLPKRPKVQYDVVCANLMHDLLMAEANRIIARVKPGGILVLAGILTRFFPAVCEVYEKAGLRLVKARTLREWRSGAFAVPA